MASTIKGQRYLTFAVKDDWAPVLSALEQSLSIKYIEDGPMPKESRPEYTTFKDLPNLGRVFHGDYLQQTRYLIMQRDRPLVYKVVKLNDGGVAFISDHSNNPQSVIFAPGGLFQEQKAVIQGEISKLATLDATQEIFNSLGKLIRRDFVHIKAWWVGSGALSLRAEGYRLTSGVNNPPEYDLQYSSMEHPPGVKNEPGG